MYRRFWTNELNRFMDLAILVALTLLHCGARFVLVVLSWTALRNLPPDALRDV